MKLHKLIFLATAAALALPASAVDTDPVWNSVKGQPAPVLQVARPADATGTYRPATVSVIPVSDAKIVQVVNDETARGNILSGGVRAWTTYFVGTYGSPGKNALVTTIGQDGSITTQHYDYRARLYGTQKSPAPMYNTPVVVLNGNHCDSLGGAPMYNFFYPTGQDAWGSPPTSFGMEPSVCPWNAP